MKGQNRSNVQKNGHRRSNSRVNNDSPNLKLQSIISKATGKKVVASIANGNKYLGTCSSNDSHGLIISNPVSVGKNTDEELPSKLIVQLKDLVDLDIVESENKDTSTFKTDSDISHGQYRERDLQRWVPDEGDAHNPALVLNDENSSGHGAWDQFKVNEERFGVESTYDEHLYTTRIDTAAPDYLDKLRRAERIAQEIENSATKDRHILEERGFIVDDSGVDEEDKYSGVDRRGVELMAALKNASISGPEQQSNPTNKVSTGKYATPRQRAAEYHNDPAIVSSSATSKKLKQPQASSHGESPANQQQSQQPQQQGQAQQKPSRPDSIPPKPPITQQQHNEAFRLNAQSEINSLREFSANFKIPHKIPTDLLPILSKDKLKQDEILKKLSEVQTTQQTKTSSPGQQKKKMDPSKPAFKLNPKAAAFTPSGKLQNSPQPPKVNFHRSPNNPSPKMLNPRPYSSGISNGSSGSGSSSKRHHQISPADFFGGANRIPTKAGQEKKVTDFNFAFNLFITSKKKHIEKDSKSAIVYEKTFQTPPTWTSNIDESHDKLFPPINSVNRGGAIGMPTSPFGPNAMLGVGAPNMPAGYPAPNVNYHLSPQQQAAAMAAHYQQQQFQAAMMYQQQFPVGPPGQHMMPMYGGEPPFMPQGGFVPPLGGFGGSPVNGNMMPTGPNHHYNNGGHNNHHGGRRYTHGQNQGKRGSQSHN